MPPGNRWRARWRAFRHPIAGEKAELLRDRWESLPAELQTANQISGRHLTHCGFTAGASYCSFHCTHCYLPKNANQAPIPSLAPASSSARCLPARRAPSASASTISRTPRRSPCVFKGAVKNRQSGEWEAIPMCAMNQQRWSDVYDERLVDPLLAGEPQVGRSAQAPAFAGAAA